MDDVREVLRGGRPRKSDLLWLGTLLGRALLGPDGRRRGLLRDIGVTDGPGGPVVSAVRFDATAGPEVMPADRLRFRHRGPLLSTTGPLSPAAAPPDRWLHRTVLHADVLTGAPVDPPHRVADVGLLRRDDGRWMLWALDTRPVWQRGLGLRRRTYPWTAVVRRRVIPTPVPGAPAPRLPIPTTNGREARCGSIEATQVTLPSGSGASAASGAGRYRTTNGRCTTTLRTTTAAGTWSSPARPTLRPSSSSADGTAAPRA
ncbi:hypothetical protein PSA01_37770 [Pseudonocardia saturnea]|uniref:Uncharacterized protein n=1 Tax=Pseudonocardia saturnea TaxID=33909 RepID=A0ABQ0S1F3_9PSEU|nr:hypothetical protein Pdca_13920 [Pseudonocardia autotrophica]GEC26748.1 hypothetical protein PSA01_37770 [Pseudonocardia saturnea]